MCLYWCQYEKFTININVFDDSFFNSKQYLSDRLTTFVIGLTKLRYRWKHYKQCVSSTSSGNYQYLSEYSCLQFKSH